MAIQHAAAAAEPEPGARSEESAANGVVASPPLENGDRLTRAEFERRYEAMPGLKKAELIEGVVYVPSPVRYTQHGQPNLWADTWLGVYMAATPGVGGAGNTTVRLDLDNEPQPDTLLRIEHGGSSTVGEDGHVEGPPELIFEVAASSASYDLHDKLRAYRRNGMREYVVWRVLDGAVNWMVPREGAYATLAPDAVGVLKSETFPGLWLQVDALLAGDLATVLATLRTGLASDEHARFVARLSGAASAPRTEADA